MERLSLPKEDMVCGISFLHQNSVSETYPMHTHDFFELFYVVKGRAMHNINGESECCMAGNLQLIRPKDCHAYSFINRYDMELISIGISRSIMEEIVDFLELELTELEKRNMPFQILFDAGKAETVLRSMIKLERINEPEKRRVYGKALIARLLYDLVNKTVDGVRLPDWLAELITEMSRPENFKAGLCRMVELSHVTQNHLNREMKKHLGMTPTEFINAKRIAYAGEILLEEKWNTTEIAERCGFDTLSHFYDNFKKVYQCSPREFIEENKRSI